MYFGKRKFELIQYAHFKLIRLTKHKAQIEKVRLAQKLEQLQVNT